MTKQALTSSGVQVIGQDTSEVIRRVAKRIVDREEAAKRKQREYDSVYHYDSEQRETIVCLIHRAGVHPRTGVAMFSASTVVELPRVGIVRTLPDQERFLQSSMRLELAKAFLGAGMCKTYDEARARAGRAVLLMERAYGRESGNAEVA